jgi:hypothetical protein
MNFIPRSISKHYRARLIAWTLSMLMWTFQALCAGMFSPRHERQRRERMSLAWLTQQVKLLIISRANDFAYDPRRRRQIISYRGCRNVLKPGFVNAMVGARAARTRNPGATAPRFVIPWFPGSMIPPSLCSFGGHVALPRNDEV